MKLRFSVREQRTLLIVVVLAVSTVWMYLAFIARPLMRESNELTKRVTIARDQLKALEIATANEAALKEQHRQLQETVKSLRSLLPAEEELPRVIELLSDLASQSQVKIQTIFPQRQAETLEEPNNPKSESKEPLVYKEVLIQIDALAGYHELGTFLSLVESGEKPMQVSSLRISSDLKESKRLHIKLLIQSYFATSGSVALAEGTL